MSRIDPSGQLTTNYTELPLKFSGSFSLSITQALREQLILALGLLSPALLSSENIANVSRQGGIYQLFLDGRPVYIGKSTDALNSRIGNHYRKLSGRTPGILDRMHFRVLYVNEDLDALAPEKMLIRALKAAGKAPWNQNGFGNKDPGRQRDTSLVKSGHFDREFPINLQLTLNLIHKKPVKSLLDMMVALKAALPYNLRFPPPRDPIRRELRRIDVSEEMIRATPMSVSKWMDSLASALPSGWMITVFPGYIIVYKETSPDKYGSREQVWLPDGHGSFSHEIHVPVFDAAPIEESDEDVQDEYLVD